MKFRGKGFYAVQNFLYDIWLEVERVFLNVVLKFLSKVPNNNPDECEHKWEVQSVDYATVSLEVTCYKCLSAGRVDDPTLPEWESAYGAWKKTYIWEDHSRVIYVRCFAD